MLPEHIEKLREWQNEDENVKRPELDEWVLNLIQEEIDLAYKSKSQVLIRTWKNGKVLEHRGTIEDIHLHSRVIILNGELSAERIPVSNIISVQSVD